jgi:hypothetical protein
MNISAIPPRAKLIGAVPIVAAMILSGAVSFGYNHLLKDSGKAVEHLPCALEDRCHPAPLAGTAYHHGLARRADCPFCETRAHHV